MTNLTGTEKQIAWATEIRSDITRSIHQTIADLKAIPKQAYGAKGLVAFQAALESVSDASWWIENREQVDPRGRSASPRNMKSTVVWCHLAAAKLGFDIMAACK